MRNTTRTIDRTRLLQAGFVLTAVGTVASIAVERAAANYNGGLWTGRITIYDFFATLELPGAVIALTIALRRGGLVSWILAAVALTPPLEAVIFAGRRETAAYLLITIGLTLYYRSRWVPSRYLIAAALIFATLIIPAIGKYRELAGKAGGAAIAKIDLFNNFEHFTKKGEILELRNAAMLIEQTEASGAYEFGTGYWDEIVWRYVPAQFLGREFKQNLMFHYDRMEQAEDLKQLGYTVSTGTTMTGLGDSFVQFGFAGCIFFCLAGILMRSLWIASLREGGIFAQLLYITTITSAMRAVTNQTTDFLPGLLFNVIFIGAAVRYASGRGLRSKRMSVNSRPQFQPQAQPHPQSHQALRGPTFLTSWTPTR